MFVVCHDSRGGYFQSKLQRTFEHENQAKKVVFEKWSMIRTFNLCRRNFYEITITYYTIKFVSMQNPSEFFLSLILLDKFLIIGKLL